MVVVLQAFALHCRYKFQGNFLHFCVAESAFLCYNKFVKKIWGKPSKIKGFSPVLFLSKPTGLVYHHDAVVYIIAEGVYHHTFRCVLKICRLDDIQNFVLMICNSYGIDDIQRQAVDFTCNL